jgi:hypothetical protein
VINTTACGHENAIAGISGVARGQARQLWIFIDSCVKDSNKRRVWFRLSE